MVIHNRGEISEPMDVINLTVQFYDNFGNPVNTDVFPQISIVQPSGMVALAATSAGVSQLGVGKYMYQFTIPFDGPFGVWNDVWFGTISGIVQTQTLSFIADFTQLPEINTDGYVALGDDPGFHYSQRAILNINKIMKSLRARLNSSGKSKSTDGYGNVIYVDCDIFSVDMLTTFIVTALSDFNQVPYFTFFTFEHEEVVKQFFDILVEGATLSALASQALIERGREFVITDNGVSFTPPTVSELLNTQYTTLLTQYYDKLKYIKNSLRPGPRGLGTFRVLSIAPQVSRLRHLRQRQIF